MMVATLLHIPATRTQEPPSPYPPTADDYLKFPLRQDEAGEIDIGGYEGMIDKIDLRGAVLD